jgi:hypothetical protein
MLHPLIYSHPSAKLCILMGYPNTTVVTVNIKEHGPREFLQPTTRCSSLVEVASWRPRFEFGELASTLSEHLDSTASSSTPMITPECAIAGDISFFVHTTNSIRADPPHDCACHPRWREHPAPAAVELRGEASPRVPQIGRQKISQS